ncbi:hypothetical protein HG531_005816 [Fusarium graminearum]|nr:hypothetical protein HG531_005816 [Fusarium graminearum]
MSKTSLMLLGLSDAGAEAVALLLAVTGVVGTGGDPDAPGVSGLETRAGHEASVVAAKDEVAVLVDLPALSLGVARVVLLASVLENTLAWLLVSRDPLVIYLDYSELTHAGSVSVGNLLLLALVVEDELLVLADAESSKVLLLVVGALGTLLALGEEKREAALRGADAGEVERAA